MERRYTLLILITFIVALAVIYSGFMSFRFSTLPFSTASVDAYTSIIEPINGVALPEGIQAGDRLDPVATPRATRIALLPQSKPVGHSYDVAIRRGDKLLTFRATTVDLGVAPGFILLEWTSFLQLIFTAGIALLTLWRGRDRAAAGMAIWTLALIAAYAANVTPIPDGDLGMFLVLGVNACFLLARVGFYFMADAIVRPILSPGVRTLYLIGFILLLGIGAAFQSFGGVILWVNTGSLAGSLPSDGVLWTASYLVPVILLFSCYRRASASQRLRLRWMLWSSVVFLTSVLLANTSPFGFPLSLMLSFLATLLAMAGFLYAILRHRVVDVSVVLDHTLVYGGMTTLVVGVLAAVNSIVQHAALGSSASLLLQIVVPLALGIVLGKVRSYMDQAVERVFFRTKYLAEKALKNFTRRCGHIDNIPHLLGTAITEIREYTKSPGVAFYENSATGYFCMRQDGEIGYPAHVDMNDPAMVAARAERKVVELAGLSSALGADGCLFPITVLGVTRGALVCVDRPGERYARNEKKLLTQVARDISTAWRNLRARENERFVLQIANGALDLEDTRAQARALVTTWTGI